MGQTIGGTLSATQPRGLLVENCSILVSALMSARGLSISLVPIRSVRTPVLVGSL